MARNVFIREIVTILKEPRQCPTCNKEDKLKKVADVVIDKKDLREVLKLKKGTPWFSMANDSHQDSFSALKSSSAQKKNRRARVNSLLQEVIGELLNREGFEEGALVTINKVETTPDLKKAKIFNKGLKAYEATLMAYRAGSISVGDYAEKLYEV
ncbi:MAG: ribosome-binding factor A, partial [Thaumarchaeota archaeon]|nr:ribosome-binding factor A [Nitrososphaerota archaeon]